jgi:cytochrome c-type biogenesis protein CcmH
MPSGRLMTPTPSHLRWWTLAVAALVLVVTAGGPVGARAQAADEARAPHGARTLMSRLVAPCCWRQTIDAHDSDLAAELRREVHARLRAGELPEAIEDDFVRRYGDRVRALPGDTDPSGVLPVVVGAAMAVALLGLVAWVRLRRRDERDSPAPLHAATRASGAADYDARLDDELARRAS